MKLICKFDELSKKIITFFYTLSKKLSIKKQFKQ